MKQVDGCSKHPSCYCLMASQAALQVDDMMYIQMDRRDTLVVSHHIQSIKNSPDVTLYDCHSTDDSRRDERGYGLLNAATQSHPLLPVGLSIGALNIGLTVPSQPYRLNRTNRNLFESVF